MKNKVAWKRIDKFWRENGKVIVRFEFFKEKYDKKVK